MIEKTSKISRKHHLTFSLLGLLAVLIGVSAIYLWQHHQVNNLKAQLANYQVTLVKDSQLSLDKSNALSALPNTVIETVSSPVDLLAFLGADNTQCYKLSQTGYYNVVAVANDRFAKMAYGCTASSANAPSGLPAHILAKKVNGTWSLISPTNQWVPIDGVDVPSCAMVNSNEVSKLVTPTCWQGTTYTLETVTNL